MGIDLAKTITKMEGETVSMTTTTSYIAVKQEFDGVAYFCASTDWRLALAPAICGVFYYTNSSSSFSTDQRNSVIDRDSSTHVGLDAMGTSDYLYIGFSDTVLGMYIDMGSNVNDQEVSLDVEYSTTALAHLQNPAFTDVSGDSDGTLSGSTTLAQDGVYTWTLPTDWVSTRIGTYQAPVGPECYWIRFCPSGALGTTVDVAEIVPVYKNTSYGYIEASEKDGFFIDKTRVGALNLYRTTSDQTLNLTWYKF